MECSCSYPVHQLQPQHSEGFLHTSTKHIEGHSVSCSQYISQKQVNKEMQHAALQGSTCIVDLELRLGIIDDI
jgi:hypothetical protein